MTRYFDGCKTIDDVKKIYRELCKKFHPDCGGDAELFNDMQSQYTVAFNRLKNVHVNKDGETYEKETTETPEQFANIINAIIHLQGIAIEIIGSWVWVSGDTIKYKDHLKSTGFWYSASKKAWYYTGEQEHSRRKGHYSMNQLRSKWGTQTVDTEEQRTITA